MLLLACQAQPVQARSDEAGPAGALARPAPAKSSASVSGQPQTTDAAAPQKTGSDAEVDSNNATAADGPDAALEGVDLGEVGSLLLLLDKGQRQAVAGKPPVERAESPPSLATGRMPSRQPAESSDAAHEVVRLDDDLNQAGREPSSRQMPSAADGRRYDDPSDSRPSRGLIDLATPEQRNVIRDAVVYIKSVLDHPASWLVIAVVVAFVVVSSARHRPDR